MTLLAFMVWALPALFGVALVSKLRLFSDRVSLIAVGTLAGLSLYTTAMYVASIVVPLNKITLFVSLLIMAFAASYLFVQRGWRSLVDAKIDRLAIGVVIGALLFSAVIGPKLLVENGAGLGTSVINAYGDIGWHTASITLFAEDQSFPPDNPILSGNPLIYPFLVNFFSGLLLRAGATLRESVVHPTVVLIPLLLTLMYCFVRDYTGKRLAGVLALVFFVFSGGILGWLSVSDDWRASGLSLIQFLQHLPAEDYTGSSGSAKGFHFLNPILSLFLPQRSFLFGMPLALSILMLLRPRHVPRTVSFAMAGILAGMVPLFHAHTVLALLPAIAVLMVLYPSRRWGVFVLAALVVGIPEVLYLVRGYLSGF